MTDALEVWAGELGVRPPLGCVGSGAGAAGKARDRAAAGPGPGAGEGRVETCPFSFAAVPARGAQHEAQVGAAAAGTRPLCRGPHSRRPHLYREALGRRAASLSLGEGKATLQPRDEPQCSALDLFKLPAAEARSQLQALVFGMAEHVESLERRLEGL